MHQWAVPHIPRQPKSRPCAKPPNCRSPIQSLSATVESNCGSHQTPSSCSKSGELNCSHYEKNRGEIAYCGQARATSAAHPAPQVTTDYSLSLLTNPSRDLRRRSRLMQLDLPFIRQRFEDEYSGKRADNQQPGQRVNRRSGKIRHNESQRSQHDCKRVQNQHSAAMAQAQIREPVCRVVLARRSKGQQAPPRARNGNEGRVKNWDAQNEYGNEPCVRKKCPVRANFQPERRHQKTQQHRAAVTHKNFRRIEIP